MKNILKYFSSSAAVLIAIALIGCAAPASTATVTSQPSAAPEITEPAATPTAADVSVGGSVEVGPAVTGIPTDQTDTPQADGGGQTGDVVNITMADNGKVVTLHIGQEFLLYLEGNVDQPERLWSLDISNQAVFSRVMGIMVIKGAQGLFMVNQPGEAILTATGDLPCRTATPPCMAPSLSFSVTIAVQ